MEPALKQRLWGAAVLVALAVIFLPMLIQGPAPESGVSDVPLDMPDAPGGEFETRELPLVTPGDMPDGGAVGMQTSPGGGDNESGAVSEAIPLGAGGASSSAALPADTPTSTNDTLHAAVAGGDYAVSFGSYATAANAQAVVRALQQSQLPGFQEAATTTGGRAAYRVRIGPYATRAAAESARLRAAHVRDDVNAAVLVLDAEITPATPPASKPAATSATAVVATQPLPPEPVRPADSNPAVAQPVVAQPAASTSAQAATPVAQATPAPAAASVGFAVQLGAFSKPADATAMRDRVRAAGMSAFTEEVKTDKGMLTRVRVGPVASRSDADQLRAQVRAKTGLDGIVRPHP